MKRRCCLPDEVGQRLLYASAVSDNQSNQSCLPATSKHESSLFLSRSLSLPPSLLPWYVFFLYHRFQISPSQLCDSHVCWCLFFPSLLWPGRGGLWEM